MRRGRRLLAEAADREAQARRRADESEAVAERLREALDALPLGVVVAGDGLGPPVRNRRAAALSTDDADGVLDAALSGRRDRRVVEVAGPPPRTLVVEGTPLVGERGKAGAVVTIEDVTELERLEAMRRDFVANLSHELRTPVGALGVLAEALSEESDPDVIGRLVGRVSVEAERANRLLDDLLDLSRIEVEGARAREEVAVADVVSVAADRLRSVASARDIELRLPDVPPTAVVMGSRRQLVSAVTNLVDNAVKYSDPGAAVEVAFRADTQWTEIAVSDAGAGIPEADRERIFERFYRVDRARSRETGGAGLGLSIVRHVALNHGGDVLVDSKEGEGSTFTLRLPTWE